MTMEKTIPIDLKIFAVMWNQSQNLTTPRLHLIMLQWLEDAWMYGDQKLLLMAFRACGKSTLIGLFAAWILYRNPDVRILVLAADMNLAKKMVRNVKRILERHVATRHLIPTNRDQWAADRFTIHRPGELRDPSMLAHGITSNITGSRADVIIYDDVEVPNTSSSLEKRNELRTRLLESRFILTAGGRQIFVGTPHHYDTIYATDQATQNPDQSDAFLQGFKDLRVPILNEKNESAWPEKFSAHIIDDMRCQVGPNRFASQMMLQPTNIAQGRLNPMLLQYYMHALDYTEAQQKPVLKLNGEYLVSASSWWDPAFGSVGGDASVWALVFTDKNGQYYLHHLEYLRSNPDAPDDEATQQCQKIAALCRRFHVPSVTVEINGIGKFLPAILKREMRDAGYHCAVIEHSSRMPKAERILEGFDAVMAAKALHVYGGVKSTPFLTEMREWRPDQKNGRDDGLDAVAGALSQEPVRINTGKIRGIKRPSWQGRDDVFHVRE